MVEMTKIGDTRQMARRIRELEEQNERLRQVLEAARRVLRTRSTLDDSLMMELDRAVNTVEMQTQRVQVTRKRM